VKNFRNHKNSNKKKFYDFLCTNLMLRRSATVLLSAFFFYCKIKHTVMDKPKLYALLVSQPHRNGKAAFEVISEFV